MQTDTLQTGANTQEIIQYDSTVTPTVESSPSVEKESLKSIKRDTTKAVKKKTTKTVKQEVAKINKSEVAKVQVQDEKVLESGEQQITIQTDTSGLAKQSVKNKYEEPIHLFSNLDDIDSARVVGSPVVIKDFTTQSTIKKVDLIERPQEKAKEKNWVFFSGIFVFIILLIIQTYYRKQLASVNSALVNMQLADKLMREKNILLKRLYFFLSLIYFLSLAFFFFRVFSFLNINIQGYNGFSLFIFLFAIISLTLLIRIGVNKIVAFIFDAVVVFKEYEFNNQIIHRNLGLLLLPILLSSYFVPDSITNLVFIIATVLLIVATIFRYFKAVQLLLKHNIVLFYSILYLCTLEILPLLVGVKFVLTLR